MPGQPSSHSSRQSSASMRAASACSRTRSGLARTPKSSRAVRWISRWSSVRPKSIRPNLQRIPKGGALVDHVATFSRGNPSTRSATMFFSTSVVPPSIVLPRARSNS